MPKRNQRPLSQLPPARAVIDLDRIDLAAVAASAQAVLAAAEKYTSWADAYNYRPSNNTTTLWIEFCICVQQAERALSEIGMSPEPPITHGSIKRCRGVDALFDWLQLWRPGKLDQWGEHHGGVWDWPDVGATSTPNISKPLAVLRPIVAELTSQPPAAPPFLKKKDREILIKLNEKFPQLMFQVDLESAVILSHPTMVQRLKYLLKNNLVCQPNGPKGGYTVTTTARDIIFNFLH
jgi:hypothetical protein